MVYYFLVGVLAFLCGGLVFVLHFWYDAARPRNSRELLEQIRDELREIKEEIHDLKTEMLQR